MVVAVDANVTEDAVDTNLAKEAICQLGDKSPRSSSLLSSIRGSNDPKKESTAPTSISRKQANTIENEFIDLQAPGTASIFDREDRQNVPVHVTKSSVTSATGSRTTRRNSLRRLLNPVQSVNSRIHPTTGYAPTPATDDEGNDEMFSRTPETQGAIENSVHKSVATVLATQTVQIAAMSPMAQFSSNVRTQRAIYKLTQASLAGHFDTQADSRNGRLVLRVIFICICINVAALAFETCDGQNRGSSAPGYPYLPGESVYKAIDHPFAWIGLLSLSPWYLQLLLSLAGKDFNLDASDGIGHRMGLLRLLRVFRLGYILRHYESMKILVVSLKASVPPLMVTMFFRFTLAMLLATAIFYAEPCYNLNTCPFTDIFNSAYFIMVTVATVGYGNQVPSTNNVPAMGIAFIAMVFGQLYLAMPLAIVGYNFQDAYEDHQQNKRRKLKWHDTILSPFDSVKLHRKSQRLCGIQYHLLDSWRVIQLTIDKMTRKGRELNELDAACAKDRTRIVGSGQAQLMGTLVEAQILRLTKIKEAFDKFSDIHGETCILLQPFVPHKRKPCARVVIISSGTDSVLYQAFGRAKKALTNQFGSHDRAPDPQTLLNSHRGQLWLALEVHDSSRVTTVINRVMMGFALLSVWIFFCESLPELAGSGNETPACQRVVKAYCSSTGFSLPDSGCFARFLNNTVDWDTPLDFSCGSADDGPSCYGSGLNF